MRVTEAKELTENGVDYVVEIYDSGHMVKREKNKSLPSNYEPSPYRETQLDRIEAGVNAVLGNESALDVLLGVN